MRQSVAAIMLVCACTAMAQDFEWTPNGVPIIQGWNIEWNGQSVVTADGGVVYAWSDTHDGMRAIYAHKVMPDGSTPWGEPRKTSYSHGVHVEPTLLARTDNSVVIAWLDYTDNTYGEIRAQYILEDGTRAWFEDALVCATNTHPTDLMLSEKRYGGTYVMWQDINQNALFYNTLYDTGNTAFHEHGLCFAAVSDFCDPNICHLPPNDALVLYQGKAHRMGQDGWTVSLNPGAGSGYDAVACAVNDSVFIVAWEQRVNGDTDLYAQALDINGQLLWPEPTVVCNNDYRQSDPVIIANDQNEAFVVWLSTYPTNCTTELRAQKLNMNGDCLWTQNGVTVCDADNNQIKPVIQADPHGGLIVVWEDYRDAEYSADIYRQHLDANGQPLWQINGEPVCTLEGNQHWPVLNVLNGEYHIYWADVTEGVDQREEEWIRPNAQSLRRQIVTLNGQEQLPVNGEIWLEGPMIDTYDVTSVVSNGVTYVIWISNSYGDNELRMQKILADGTGAWGDYGLCLTEFPGISCDKFSVAARPEGGVAFAFEYSETGNIPNEIRFNEVDESGTLLWGETGVSLCSPIVMNESPKITILNDGYLVAWVQLDFDTWESHYQVHAQKVFNGAPCWGGGVVVIADSDMDYHLDNISEYCIACHDSDDRIFLARLTPEGEIAAGFDPPIEVAQSEYSPKSRIKMVDDNCLLLWEQTTGTNHDIYGQIYTPAGENLWREGGAPLVSSPSREYNPRIVCKEDRFYMAYMKGTSFSSVLLQAYDYNAEPNIWQEPMTLSDEGQYNTIKALAPCGDGVVCVWNRHTGDEYNEYVYAQFVTANGDRLWNENGALICDSKNEKYYVTLANDGDEHLHIFWSDSRNSRSRETMSIYGQRIHIDITPVGDADIPAPTTRLAQNTPNPFNPETTISFSLAETGRATLTVYNIRGQRVRRLVDGELTQGAHSIVWDGRDDAQSAVGSGVYLYRLETQDGTRTRRMLLLK